MPRYMLIATGRIEGCGYNNWQNITECLSCAGEKERGI
jgi:hypothetical protein